MQGGMKHHPYSEHFPLMADAQIAELAEDIRVNGQINPIWIYEGMILDGRNRYRACVMAGVKPMTQEYRGDRPLAFAWSCNGVRNHYTSGQRAASAAEIMPELMREAKKRQGTRNDKKNFVEQIPQSIKARDEAARITGTNPKYVDAAVKIKDQSPDTFAKLKAGTITLQDAKREAARKPDDDWKNDERIRQKEVMAGNSVVANYEYDKNLIAWAEKKGISVTVDRGSRFGNPFVLGGDGSRDEVCDKYEKYYLPHKPSITSRVDELRGKVLCCHCYPERCHAESLVKLTRSK